MPRSSAGPAAGISHAHGEAVVPTARAGWTWPASSTPATPARGAVRDRVLSGRIDPGRVFDLTPPLDRVADGYRAVDERRAVKTLLRP